MWIIYHCHSSIFAWFNIVCNNYHPAFCYLKNKKLFLNSKIKIVIPSSDLNLGPKAFSLLEFEIASPWPVWWPCYVYCKCQHSFEILLLCILTKGGVHWPQGLDLPSIHRLSRGQKSLMPFIAVSSLRGPYKNIES